MLKQILEHVNKIVCNFFKRHTRYTNEFKIYRQSYHNTHNYLGFEHSYDYYNSYGDYTGDYTAKFEFYLKNMVSKEDYEILTINNFPKFFNEIERIIYSK